MTLEQAKKAEALYQKSGNNCFKSYISFKIDSAMVKGMPIPKPMYEIFIYSSYMEAISYF